MRWLVTCGAIRARVGQMMEREGFLRVKEAARLLDVAPNTVRAWGAAGKIPEYRHPANNYRLYKKTDLEKLLNKVRRAVKSAEKKTRAD